MNQTANRRKWFEVRMRSRIQFQFAAYFIGGMVGLTWLLTAYLLKAVDPALASIAEVVPVDPAVATFVHEWMQSSLWFLSGVMLLISLFSLFVWLRISNRIFGPMVRFKAHIEELRKGNYKSRVELRKDDNMPDIAELKNILNLLAQDLEARGK